MKLENEKIQNLKKKHGEIYEIEVVDHEGKKLYCYLRKPNREEYFAYYSYVASTPMRGFEILLNSCWIEGDDEIMDDDKAFFAALGEVSKITDIYESNIKKN
jgi:hypothetical protein